MVRLTPKMNITFFIAKLDVKYFLSDNFFEKSSIFEKIEKNCFRSTFDDFLGKGGVSPQKLTQHFLSQIRYRIFYYLAKTVPDGQVPFEGKGASGDENEYNLFFWNYASEYFFEENNIF